MMNERYHQVDGSRNPPPPYELSSQPQFGHANNYVNTTIEYNSNPLTTSSQQPLKPWRAIKYLAAFELLLALLCSMFGSACWGIHIILFDYLPINDFCMEASGIWIGIFCSVTGSLGLGALVIPTGRRCLLVSYFVMSIVSTIGCGILLIFSSFWARLSKLALAYDQTNYTIYLVIYAFNLVLVASSLTHFVMSIVSTSLICYNWNCCCCGTKPQTVTIVHSGARPEVGGHSSSYHNV